MRDLDDQDADATDPIEPAPMVDIREATIRFSALKHIDRSPAHYRHAALHRLSVGCRRRKGPSPARRLQHAHDRCQCERDLQIRLPGQ